MRLLKIGRDPSSDIVIPSQRVSSYHAEIIILNNGDILLEDKNSRNGTYVMNRQIKPGVPVNIRRGDTIRFADTELEWSQVPRPDDNSAYKAVYGIGSNLRNEINVNGNSISRFHATLKIDKKNNAYLIDHSTNGTTVNGKRISSNVPVKVKSTDKISFAGIPVDLSKNIPTKINFRRLGIIAAAAVAIVAVVLGISNLGRLINFNTGDSIKDPTVAENATACVYGSYYYTITVKDDPFRNVLKGWPEKFYIGYENGQLSVALSTDKLDPVSYTGTAFFISENGELGTNRHIAVPWKYMTPQEEDVIRQTWVKFATGERSQLVAYLRSILKIGESAGVIPHDDAQAWFDRFLSSAKSNYEIDGIHTLYGVGLTGHKIENLTDILGTQTIAESGDDNIDVAIIRLKDPQTPKYLVDMGAIFDIEKARTDETSLKPQKENFYVIGYPYGPQLSNLSFDGKELHPTMHKVSISKKPDEYAMQIQTVGIGGQSGSPMFDEQGRLVGVLCSGVKGTEVTYCCNIKHLKALYDKHKFHK